MRRQLFQQGAAAIEFALMLVIMIPLAFGITELGRAFYQYNTLVKSVRDGVRVLAAGGAAKKTQATCLTVYGNPGCTGAPLLEGLSTSIVDAVTDKVAIEGNYQIKVATVTINGYQFNSLVPMVVPDFTFGPVSATMRQE